MTTHLQRRPGTEFRRDRLTWIAYALITWFAYLQAAPGLVVGHLRDELHLSYSTGGLHVAGFAAGSLAAGVISARLERALGRRTLCWSAAALMGAGAIGLTAGRVAGVTIGAVLVMGVGGGLLLVTIQAALADHHGERRAVALAEASLAASVAYVVLIGMLSLTAALHAGWRTALVASLVVPMLMWWSNRRLAIDAPPPSPLAQGRLPGVFWLAAAMLFCTTAAEWCINAWGAIFVENAAGVSTDIAVALMAGYFGGVVAGRTLGSRLARRHDPARLLAYSLAVTAAGFAILWPSTALAQALVGLSLLGIGIGNLFPMALSVTVALVPGRAGLASGRAVATMSFAVLLAPLAVGMLADATSLRVALGVVPVVIVLAAAGLTLIRRARSRASDAVSSRARMAVPRLTGDRAGLTTALSRAFRRTNTPECGGAAGHYHTDHAEQRDRSDQ
jgi:MFS family permease